MSRQFIHTNGKRWLVFVAMAAGYACSILDTTITHVALPSISRQLHTDLAATAWVVHSYNIVFVVCLILSGQLADHVGRKRIFLLGLSLFGLSSLACSFAPSLTWLIGFRVVQAIGGSCLGSIGFAIVSQLFGTQQRVKALGIWSAIAAIAAITGPILGGLVLSFSWRWIFLINLPCCLAGLLLTLLFLPAQPERKCLPQHLDLLGMIFLSLSLTSLTLILTEGSGWGLPVVLFLVFTFVLSSVSFLLVEHKSTAPLVVLSLFRLRSFAASCIGMFLFWTAYQGATILLSLYFLNAQARTPETTALLLMPVPLANVLTSLLNLSWPAWIRVFLGISCGICGFLSLAMMNPYPLWYATFLPCVLIGVGASLCFTSFHLLVMLEVPKEMLGQASGIFNTFRQLATTIGAAILLGSISEHLQAGFFLLSHQIGSALTREDILPFTQRQQAVKRFLDLFHQVIAVGGTGQLPMPVMFDSTNMQLWNSWFFQQLHLVVVDAFSQSWLLSALFALAAFSVLPFLRQEAIEPYQEAMIFQCEGELIDA